jgi:ribose transport system substrate-binding protein
MEEDFMLVCKKIWMAVMVAVLIVGGIGTAFAAGERESDSDVVQIGFAPATYDLTDYYGQAANAMRAYWDENGLEYEFVDRAPEMEGDVAAQISLVEQMIATGIDYLIIGPSDYFGAVPAIQAANEAGIPVFVCAYLEQYPADENVEVEAYFGEDNRLGGQTTGEYVWEQGYLNEGDKFAMLKAYEGNKKSDDRGSAEEIWIERGAERIYTSYDQWEAERAFTSVERILQADPDVKLIYAISSAMAIGAANALEASGRSDVHVFGFGGVISELDMIWEGAITGAGFRDPQGSGVDIGRALMQHMEGESIQKQYPIPFRMVDTKDDIVNIIPRAQLELMENWQEVQEFMNGN